MQQAATPRWETRILDTRLGVAPAHVQRPLLEMTIPDHITQIECDEIGIDEDHGDVRIAKFVAIELAPLIGHDAKIITVDGFDGTGKSTLSCHLGAALDLPLVHLDDCLVRQKSFFLDAIKFDELSNRISEALKRKGRVVVEGCLVDTALARIGLGSEFRVYVMRTTKMRSDPVAELVQEYDALYGDKPTGELIAELEEVAWRAARMPEEFGGGGSGELPSLERELIQYHRDVRPHDLADLIVKVVHTS